MDYLTTLHTSGDGYWSNARRAVRITNVFVPWVDDERLYGELRVFFEVKDWDVTKLGLIYTDSLFLKELQQYLASIGYNSSDIDYSEQGMQGDNYISLDAGTDFIISWVKKNDVEYI